MTRELHRGKRQGDTYVRVVRSDTLRRVAPGYLRASEQVSRPTKGLGLLYRRVKVWLVGKPLPTIAEKDERLTKLKALAVFSSDAISSSAYATEEILLVLVAAGTLGLPYALPIALGIAILLAIVSFSYRQTVHAYPHGGGSYTVSRENLGTQAGLVAAAALLIDYVLTVAVSIAAGTAAITSAAQPLYPYRVEISVVFIGIITLINLRGIRESGTIFALPTYLFIFSLAGLILLGAARVLMGEVVAAEPHFEHTEFEPLGLFLILHAFAAGSVAMSGTEAIANGVPAFKSPETHNAATTLTWMAGILGVFFVGVTFLAHQYGLAPTETETVISQLGRAVLGNGVMYGVFQAATMMILVLAANTSFNGFPRLFSVLARDGFAPRQFLFRGDRLAFSYGIIVLGAVAALLIVAFGGSTHALIPLYAVGVFLSFTLSQFGMVRHWWRLRAAGWQRSLVINATGGVLTGIVLLIVGSVKFQLGAWIVVVLTPILVLIFNVIYRHYHLVAEQVSVTRLTHAIATPRQIVVVPIGDINIVTLRALAFARSLAKDPVAVHITYETEEAENFREQWTRWGNGTQLVLLESPFRSFTEPLIAYIDALHLQDPEAFLILVLPESIPAHWWQHLLHNQTALRLKAALLFRRNTVVLDVPYHLER
ncbi:MAG: APC family permease [Chloroflexi bacterium]|nr:APC family permease [Chloroflexota bacterium]